jgi:hypothetical protein
MDELEASFARVERQDEEVAQLRDEVALLKGRLEAQVRCRPALCGARAERSPFVDSYLRKGLEAGVELKAMVGTRMRRRLCGAGGDRRGDRADADGDLARSGRSPMW